MKDAYYFSHDSNARHDPKLSAVRAKYGWTGYGLYWSIIEVLRDQDNYGYPNGLLYGLALAIGFDHNSPECEGFTFDDFVKDLISFGLLKIENDVLFSSSLIQRMEALSAYREKLSESGKRGAEVRWAGHKGANATPIKGANATPIAVKESKVKESKVIKDTPIFDFNSLLSKYPNKDGSKIAEQKFRKSVKTEKDWSDINTALSNYLKSKHVQNGFIKNASTWFNNWRDWIDYSESGEKVSGSRPFPKDS